jgi:hypothetical protein
MLLELLREERGRDAVLLRLKRSALLLPLHLVLLSLLPPTPLFS